MSHGSFIWNELNTPEPDKAKAFFAETIGWEFRELPMPQGAYLVIREGGKDVGGIFPMTGPEFAGIPSHWLAYLDVDDVDARLAKARAAGASVLREPFDIPGIGRMAVLQDPTGAVMAWMTPAMPAGTANP